MSKYIRLSNLEYPLHEGDIRLEHPEIPDDLTHPNFPCPDGFAEVFGETPEYNSSIFEVVELAPKLINGVWVAQFSEPRKLTQVEIDVNRMRVEKLTPKDVPLSVDQPGEIPNVII